MELVNLTDHPIVILPSDGGAMLSLPPSGTLMRVDFTPVERRFVEFRGRVIEIVTDGVVQGIRNLPPPKEGVVYVASYSATHYCNTVLGRHDVVCPATAKKDSPLKIADDVVAVRRLRGS